MAGPRVFVEFFEVLHQFCSQWIQVDIADQLQEVRVFFTDDRFVAVLEEMAAAFMAFVEGDGISGHETAHDFAEWSRACA